MLDTQIVKEGLTATGVTRQRGVQWVHGVDLLGADDDGDGFRLHLTVEEAEIIFNLAIAHGEMMKNAESEPAS